MARTSQFPIKSLYNINPRDKTLYVAEIGHHCFAPGENPVHACEKNLFCIHYIIKGKLRWPSNKILSTGYGFIHTSNHIALKRIGEEPLEYSFIKISGIAVKKFLTECNMPIYDNYFSLPYATKIGETIKEAVYTDLSTNNLDFFLTGLLYHIMSFHAPNIKASNTSIHINQLVSKQKNLHLQTAISYISNNYAEPISLKKLSHIIHLSPDYMSKIFKEAFGISFQEYLMYYRINIAESLLSATDLPISQISDMVGYSNSQHFSQLFKRVKCYTPTNYRKAILKDTQISDMQKKHI